MADSKERQTSFVGGELSPTLWGRTDLGRYLAGARKILNFIVMPHGPLTSRTGTQHVAVLNHGLASKGRLKVFLHPDDDPALLVFLHRRVVILGMSDDPRHAFPDWDTETIELPTEYQEDDLHLLRFSQVGITLKVTAEGYPPIVIQRGEEDAWSIDYVSFDVPDFRLGYSLSENPGFWPVTLDASFATHFDGSGSYPAREWKWAVTRIIRRTNGTLYESAPYVITHYSLGGAPEDELPDNVAVYADWTQRIKTRVVQGAPASSVSDETIEATRIYRGRDGRYGYIGETKANYFVDDGADPDFSRPPPQEFNPFAFYDEDGNLERTEYPTLVETHENRCIFAATPERPELLLGSALGDHSNFDEIKPARDDASYNFQITGPRIRALVGLDKLLALTSGEAFLIGGSGEGQVITPNSIASRKLGKHPCSGAVAPLVVGDVVFYPSLVGVEPRALMFGGEKAQSLNVALPSRHLFKGYTIVDWDYAEHPFSVFWVVRSDGKLLSGTWALLDEGPAIAWAQHDISGDGLVEAVTVRPEEGEHGVYLVVNRDGIRTLERLAYDGLPLRTVETEGDDGETTTEDVPDVRYAIYLDRAVSYNGKQSGDFSFRIVDDVGGAGSSEGAVGTIVRFAFSSSPVTGLVEGDIVQIDDPAGGEPYRFVATTDGGSDWEMEIYNRELDESLFAEDETGPLIGGDEWYICRNSVSGLSHLEGETVTALADGDVYEGLTVQGGSISLGEAVYGALIHVGLPYDADFLSLAAVNEKGRRKIVEKAILELERTRGGAVGTTFDNLRALRGRSVSDAYVAAATRHDEVEVPVSGKWGDPAYVAFRQSAPLPCTLLGITRFISYGG